MKRRKVLERWIQQIFCRFRDWENVGTIDDQREK
jgi:hypothetical protein